MANSENARDSQRRHADSQDGPCTFSLIHWIRREIDGSIDSVISPNELHSSQVDYAILKPLLSSLAKTRSSALLYALLLLRTHYKSESEEDLAFQGLNSTRAALCEMLATKLLSLYEQHGELPVVLTTRFNPFQGVQPNYFEAADAPSSLEFEELREEGEEMARSALDVAIESGAKRFIGAPAFQQFINDLYNGTLLFKPSSQNSIMKDVYKSETVEFFDLPSRPLLDHNVLRVPRIRRFLAFAEVLVLVLLFFWVQQVRNVGRLHGLEVFFIFFTCGFALSEITSLRERGLQTYVQHIWNVFDLAYLAIFLSYIVVRTIGLAKHSMELSTLSFDILALGACILFPRLCGMLIRDSVVLLGLRAMLVDFVAFTFLAVLCSVGFLLAFWVLADGQMTLGEIAWVLVKVFLGSSYLGFEVAPTFGRHIGPALMLIFAVFASVLLLTILISILTNTFSQIQFNLVEESLYQQTVTTLDMVKGDALFEFVSPTNLIALPLLIPASVCLGPRSFHRFNVFLIRFTNFPLLVFIHLYYKLQRRVQHKNIQLRDRQKSDLWSSIPRRFRKSGIQLVFERKVSKEGRRVKGLLSEAADRSRPMALRGSGGQTVLGLHPSNQSEPASVQPTSLLGTLFGAQAGRAPNSSNMLEDRYSAMENRLEKIEGMLQQLLTGGLKVDNDDR